MEENTLLGNQTTVTTQGNYCANETKSKVNKVVIRNAKIPRCFVGLCNEGIQASLNEDSCCSREHFCMAQAERSAIEMDKYNTRQF